MTFNSLIRLVRREVETMISRNLAQNLAICLAPLEGVDCLQRRKKQEKENGLIVSEHISLILVRICNHVTETLVDPRIANL